MASEEHKKLAEFIKNVHVTLRVNARKLGSDEAWEDHCQQKEMLDHYAECMYHLATEHWDNNSGGKIYSRIRWIVEQSLIYFLQGKRDIEKCKEMKRLKNLKSPVVPCEINAHENMVESGILKLLDVGSCYNPFKKFSYFEVLPIDLHPASDDVFKVDFLKLIVSNAHMETGDITKSLPICTLPENHFDIVVFSLLLEYLPSPHQRLICCEKAYRLLKPEGLLFIISPDSKHASANASLMRKWRICLAFLGFTRIVYEKRPHIHCMAFRKNCNAVVSREWAHRSVDQEFHSFDAQCSSACLCGLLQIPQDDTEYFTMNATNETEQQLNQDYSVDVGMFDELPYNAE